MKKAFLILFATLVLSSVFSLHGTTQKFLKDDPITEDNDRFSIPKPTERPLSKTVDLLQKTFTTPKSGNVHAVDVNTLEEVPNSSWFTNRMGQKIMTIDELVKGPDQGSGPDLSQPVRVVNAKIEGITPGLLIKDAKGDRYFFKFDSLPNPQMATSSEVVGTKFYHAFGYNVAENYLVYWNPKSYVIGSKAKVIWDTGKQETLSIGYVENILRKIPRRRDGTIQTLASKFLPGEPVGPYDYQDKRKDDPNDIYPHEDRRELRGLRVFNSLMNHNDSDSVNSLDMYYTDPNGSKYVKHYMIDFGTVLGSGSNLPHSRRVGHEYYIEFTPIWKALGTLGLWERDWHSIPYRDFRSVGRFESASFHPETWLPDYPNPAGVKMDKEDAYWATRTVMNFTDEMIRAIVHTGNWEETGAEKYVGDNLIERRDKIVHYYLAQINPLDNFHLSSTGLTFENLGVKAGLASDCSYQYDWFRFDNETQKADPLALHRTNDQTSIPIPNNADAAFLMVHIASLCSAQPAWKFPVAVYIRNGSSPSIVGIERHQ